MTTLPAGERVVENITQPTHHILKFCSLRCSQGENLKTVERRKITVVAPVRDGQQHVPHDADLDIERLAVFELRQVSCGVRAVQAVQQTSPHLATTTEHVTREQLVKRQQSQSTADTSSVNRTCE